MDTETQTATVDTSTSTENNSSTTETSGAEISSLDSTSGNGASTETAAAGATGAENTPAWTPNFEFTVKDKKHQIDELFKPAITTKEAETKLKELYEKAYGLDEVKQSRETFKEKLAAVEAENLQTKESLQVVGGLLKKQDFNTFFQLLGVPKEQFLNYAKRELQILELPAEQQAAIEEQRQQQQMFMQAQSQNQSLQQQLQTLHVNQARQELQMEISRPDVSTVAQAFDTRMGKPGAFMSEVIKRGQLYEAVHRTSPPASQLVNEVLQLVGLQNPGPQGQSAPQAIPSQGVVPTQEKPVIPAFNGASAQKSPVRKAVGSLQDLREIRKQL